MKEQINNFREIVEDYYHNLTSKDVRFDFMHVYFRCTYIAKNYPIYDLNEGVMRYKDERMDCRKTLFIPVIMNKYDYEKMFADDHFHTKRDFWIPGKIDIGDSDNPKYNEVYEGIFKVLPKECKIISDEELKLIANKFGYDSFEWNIYDKDAGLPSVFYYAPNWVYDIYGIKN